MRKCMGTSRGVTLVEVMGALAVSTLLLSGVWNLFQGGMQSYQRGVQDVQMAQRTRALLTMLTRDIQRALAAHVPYGIHGTPQQAAPVDATRRADRLVLLTAPPTLRGEPQRVRYVFTALPTGNTLTLERAVATTGGKQTERSTLLHDHVQAFQLRYFDGQTWSDEWQQAEVPRALEITLVVQSRGPQPRTYQFATLVTAD